MKSRTNAMKTNRHLSLSSLWALTSRLAVGWPLLATAGLAQEPANDDSVETGSEIVQLSPFNVTSERDYGYRASNSIAGTRSNTPIKEIPLNIQVFTKELTDDLSITSQVDLERYNAALVNGGADVHSDNPIQQSYNGFLFRGFVQNWGMRDGNRHYDPIDSQGLARVEIIKGPAAALYGLTYPGGVMNSITKDVDFKANFTSLRLTGQSEGEYRGAIDANYSGDAGGSKFGLRFNAVNGATRDYRDHSDGKVQHSQVNLAWLPTPTTELKLLAERGFREKPNGLGYFSVGELDAEGDPVGNGADIPLQVTHPSIPWTWNWSTEQNMRTAETKFYRGTINQSIGDNLSVTGYVQYSDRVNVDSDGWDAQGGGGGAASWDMGFSSQGVRSTGWLNPNTAAEVIRLGYHYRDWCNSMHSYGATALYKLDLGSVKNTFTVGGNAWKESFISHKSIQPALPAEVAETGAGLVTFPVRANLDTTAVPIGPPADYFVDVQGAYGRERNFNDYYFASWQMSALEQRLRTNIAVNRTSLKLQQFNNGYSLAPENVTEQSKTSPMYGAMFDLTKEVSAFAVHSTSLFPTTDKNDFFVQMPPVVGESIEGGFKIELLNGKISGTISYYQINQTGGSQRDPTAINRNKQRWDGMSEADRRAQFPGLTRDELPSANGQLGDFVAGGKQESKGYEADLIVQPTRNWQVLLSYAHNDVEVTEAINPATIGQSTTGHIKDQFSFLTKYTFGEGTVKGLSLGLGGQLAGKALQGYLNGVARYNPSTVYLETFAGYRFKLLDRETMVQLNIKNLTRQEEFVGWKATGSASRLATERYEVPTQIRYGLTVGLDF